MFDLRWELNNAKFNENQSIGLGFIQEKINDRGETETWYTVQVLINFSSGGV